MDVKEMDLQNDTDGRTVRISGTVEGIIYANEENGYTVCDVGTDDDLVTAVGIMPYLSEGEKITIYGHWEHNSKYGRQFKVEQYEKELPADDNAILRYLSSRTIKGIGPKTAIKIVEAFGSDSFDVIENHPEWLADIPGISRNKAEEISENFKAQSGMRSVMMFCREYFGTSTTVKIYKRWGSGAVDVIKKNPYRLCDEIYGIGFERADAIAASLGVDKSAAERIQSGMIYLLSHNSRQNGHVCLPREKATLAAAKLLGVEEAVVKKAAESLISDGRLVSVKIDGADYFYTRESYDEESYIAKKLVALDKFCPGVSGEDIEGFIIKAERESGMIYADLQRKAISDSLEHGVTVLTGGPGTGKTTVVRALLKIYENMGMDCALAAPTGRAAKRMSEATSREAKTIHRLLEMQYGEEERAEFLRGENNLLDENVIIVDEASMIDNSLFCSLLKAIKPGARLILIGDADQLPSVGAGRVLYDLIESRRFATVKLTEIFRQAKHSLIVTNAHRINRGEMPELSSKDGDFFFISREREEDIAATVADLYLNRLPKKYGADAKNNIQVISPSRKGLAGTENLNVMLQSALNPPAKGKKEYRFRELVFRVGDRVMQTKNDYDIEWEKDGKPGRGIFNGDIGVITDIDVPNQTAEINFDERVCEYDLSLLDELEHAYAVTVHKSQGSEYPIVIVPMYACAPMLLARNLLYTAVTRAEKMVILVGRKDIIRTMVDNDRESKRYTGLVERLQYNA